MELKVNFFLITPQPKKDEFILSFLKRLKTSNAYPNLNSVIYTIFNEQISRANIAKGNFNKIILSKAIDQSIDVINNLCLSPENYYCVSNVMLCPMCIEEQDYIPINWYKKYSICSTHNIPYISRCPYCQKLINWDTEEFIRCKFCKKLYSKNINKFFVPLEDFQEKDSIYFVYKNILNYKFYCPDSISFSLENLSNGLKESILFISNSNNVLDSFIRKIFFRKDYLNLNGKLIEQELFLIITKIIYLDSILFSNKDKLLGNLKKYISPEIFLILKYYMQCNVCNYQDVYNFIQKFSGNYYLLNIECISNILNLNLSCVELLFKKDIRNDQTIPTQSFFNLCIAIFKKSIKIDLGNNYYYLHKLPIELQIQVIQSPFTFLYNFNIDTALKNVKICKYEISKMN